MLQRVKEIAYDNVAKVFVSRDQAGRKISIPFGGSSEENIGKRYGREANVARTVSSAQTLFLDLETPYGPQEDVGITWDPSTKTFNLEGGMYRLEWGVYLDPGGSGGSYTQILQDTAVLLDNDFGSILGIDSNMGNAFGGEFAWTVEDLDAGASISGTAAIFVKKDTSLGIAMHAPNGGEDLVTNYAYAQFVRL